jgi:phosphoserine phosphatase
MTETDPHHFAHMLPRKSLLRPLEVADVLRVTGKTVTAFVENGRLCSHSLNAGAGERMHRRITRNSVALFLYQTKDYDAADYLAGVVGLLGKLSANELRTVREQMPKLIEDAETRQTPVQGIGFKAPIVSRGGSAPSGAGSRL